MSNKLQIFNSSKPAENERSLSDIDKMIKRNEAKEETKRIVATRIILSAAIIFGLASFIINLILLLK